MDNTTRADIYLEDLMQDSHYEPSTDDTTAGTAMEHISHEEFLGFLEAHQEKLRAIRELSDAGYSPKEIASLLHIPLNTVYADRRRIGRYEEEFVKE